MESTGAYWKPVWNVLESEIRVILANAKHVRALPGEKTDDKDGKRLASYLRHGLIPASFVPARDIRELRDLRGIGRSCWEMGRRSETGYKRCWKMPTSSWDLS